MLKTRMLLCLIILFFFFFISTIVSADVKVLVIPKGLKASYWKSVNRGAQQAGMDLGVDVTFRGPVAEDQHEAQTRIIVYGIKKKYDAIVLAPNHVSMTGPALERAVAAGIKVVLIDSDMDTRYHSSFIESDNYRAGQTAAAHMASLIDGAGRVFLARHIENHASTHAREQGFLDTIQSFYPQMHVVAAPYVGESTGDAYHAVLDFMGRSSGPDAIFSVGEEASLGILRALERTGFQRKIKFIGFDFNPTLKDAILNQKMDASIVQNPFQMGYLAVKTACQLIQNKGVPTKIHTDTMLINAANFQSEKVQAFIHSNYPAQ